MDALTGKPCWTPHSDLFAEIFLLARPAVEALHAKHLGSIPGDPTTGLALRIKPDTGSIPGRSHPGLLARAATTGSCRWSAVLLTREIFDWFLHSGVRAISARSLAPRELAHRDDVPCCVAAPFASCGVFTSHCDDVRVCVAEWLQRDQPSRAHTHSGIAHSVERQTCTLKVAGSNPASKTLALRSLGHVEVFRRSRSREVATKFRSRPAEQTLHATTALQFRERRLPTTFTRL